MADFVLGSFYTWPAVIEHQAILDKYSSVKAHRENFNEIFADYFASRP